MSIIDTQRNRRREDCIERPTLHVEYYVKPSTIVGGSVMLPTAQLNSRGRKKSDHVTYKTGRPQRLAGDFT